MIIDNVSLLRVFRRLFFNIIFALLFTISFYRRFYIIVVVYKTPDLEICDLSIRDRVCGFKCCVAHQVNKRTSGHSYSIRNFSFQFRGSSANMGHIVGARAQCANAAIHRDCIKKLPSPPARNSGRLAYTCNGDQRYGSFCIAAFVAAVSASFDRRNA